MANRKKPAAARKSAATKKSASKETRPAAAPDLEEAMEELATLVAELESGQTTLADALEKFERGMHLVRLCDTTLNEAATKIEIVRRMTEDGVEIEPYDSTATIDRQEATHPSSEKPGAEDRLF